MADSQFVSCHHALPLFGLVVIEDRFLLILVNVEIYVYEVIYLFVVTLLKLPNRGALVEPHLRLSANF